MMMQNTIPSAAATVLKDKLSLVRQLQDCCTKYTIACFAEGALAHAARNGLALSDEEILAPWRFAIPRSDLRSFLDHAEREDFSLRDTGLGTLEFSVSGENGQHILIAVYDAVPFDMQVRQTFLAEMRTKNAAYLALREKGMDTAEQYAQLQAFAASFAQDDTATMTAPLVCADVPPVNRALLYPLKNKAFHGGAIRVSAHEIALCESLPFEREKLAVLAQFDAFCRKHELTCFAISQLAVCSRMYAQLSPEFSVLAMEMGMLREEFDRLLPLVQNSGEFSVCLTDRDGKLDGSLRLSVSANVEDEHYFDTALAILPYDDLPEEEKERLHFLGELQRLNTEYAATFAADLESPDTTPRAPAIYKQIHTCAVRYQGKPGKVRRIAHIECCQSKRLFYQQIFPVVRCALADIAINLPNDLHIWAEKSDIDYNNAVNAYKTEILKRFNHLTNVHEITTFAIADLLIGAVTYHDFIPDHPDEGWDVAMLRADYEKLLPILREKAEDYGLAFSEFRDSEQLCPKATKTVSLNDDFRFKGELRLVPFDKMPEPYDTQYAFLRKLRRRNKLFKQLTELEMAGKQTLSKKALRKAQHKYGKGKDMLLRLYREIDTLSQFYNNDLDIHLYGRMALEKSKFIAENDLFPLRTIAFRDMELHCPIDYSVWTPVIDEALHFQVTSIQKADLILIDKLDEICRKLDIGYFICGGSMLGYMRHGGFIPWDDDIDVGMLRADYDRFMHEAGALLDERFFLQTRQSDPHIPYLFSKLRLNNTEYITRYNERRAFHKGICLDIFPFDFIPNQPEDQNIFKKEVIALSKVHNRIVNNQMPEPIDPYAPRNLREWYYKGYGILKRIYFKMQSLKRSQKAYLDHATRFNSQAEELELTTVASFVPSYTYITLDDLLPYQDVLFEGHRVKVPHRPDVFLTMQYGDYMQLPPKHNQVAHRLLRWSVDTTATIPKSNPVATTK